MRHEVIASIFNWEQKNIRQLAIITLSALIISSMVYHVYNIYSEIKDHIGVSSQQNTHMVEPQNEKKIKANDFQLLFGFNQRPEAPPQKNNIPTTRLNLTLHGALAALQQGSESSAIIQGSTQGKVYQVGDTLPGGATLFEVHSNHVVLKRNNQLEILPFPDMGKDAKGIEPFQQDSQAQHYKKSGPGYTEQPDSDSLEERMRKLREQLQQANQGS